MKIEARKLRKRFNKHWIIHDFSFDFEPGGHYAIKGANGSGKSTLLKLLSGQLLPNSGKLHLEVNGNQIQEEAYYHHLSICAPSVELIEELTGTEAVDFHQSIRGFQPKIKAQDLWDRLAWPKRIAKQTVRSYSSGMKQRLKLLLALASESSALFLDEPTSNLDMEGVNWYHDLLSDWKGTRTCIIASNERRDFLENSTEIQSQQWTKPIA